MSKPEHDPIRSAAKKPSAPVGGYVLSDSPIEINAGRPTVTLEVRNTGDRPIQVGSHFHFFESNRELEFDRECAFGMRLDIPAGTAIRFEPGDQKTVTLVPVGGNQRVYGFNNLVDGSTTSSKPDYQQKRAASLARADERGFKTKK